MTTLDQQSSTSHYGSSEESSSSKGIDINDALSILSKRAACKSSHSKVEELDEKKRNMGQTIDLSAWTRPQEKPCECPGSTSENSKTNEDHISDEQSNKKRELEEASRHRMELLKIEMQSWSMSRLLHDIFRLQSERVQTYKNFDDALETVLGSGNITSYPTACAKATASFSVISNTVNLIKSTIIGKHSRSDLQLLIDQLQDVEKKKLHSTAALHLEKIRENNEVSTDGGGEIDDKIVNLLRNGIISQQQTIANCVETINEVLEELRYAVSEE